MKGEQYFKELIAGKRQGIADRSLMVMLKIAAVLYSFVMRLRAVCYRSRLISSRSLPRPVISVGNLTMGGTGKTPTVLLIAGMLMEQGKRVAVLTRGYGGALEGETHIVSDGSALLLSPQEAGDEPCLLATSLPGLVVVMGSNRYRAGLLALEQCNPDIFILDDGFQHLGLQRDLDILLLDGRNPFSGGRVFPSGYLREPVAAAGRADLIIFTRCSGTAPQLPTSLANVPSVTSNHSLTGWKPLGGGTIKSFSDLTGLRAIAFAGIADPAHFFDALEAQGVAVVATLAFPDHTHYGTDELEALGRLKQEKKADILITTGKDAVKLIPYVKIIGNCSVAVMELKLGNPQLLLSRLENLL